RRGVAEEWGAGRTPAAVESRPRPEDLGSRQLHDGDSGLGTPVLGKSINPVSSVGTRKHELGLRRIRLQQMFKKAGARRFLWVAVERIDDEVSDAQSVQLWPDLGDVAQIREAGPVRIEIR